MSYPALEHNLPRLPSLSPNPTSSFAFSRILGIVLGMELSVAIPVRNRPAELRRCLEGLAAQDFAPEWYEVIVVDNGSTDDTARVAQECGARSGLALRVVSEPEPNRCRARNRGAAEARAPWVAFLDSDCVPEPGWLCELAQTIRNLNPEERVAAIAGPVHAAPPVTTVEAYIARRRWIDQEKFLTPGRRFSPPFAATANLAVRRDVYLELGGLDPELHVAGEDADWCWRAATAGWSLAYAQAAAVVHTHRATLGGLWRQSYHYGIGNAELFAKWRAAWGARVWIEPRTILWAAKALLKTPYGFLAGRTPLDRREAFYDFVANTAMVLGRMRGGLKRRVWVL